MSTLQFIQTTPEVLTAEIGRIIEKKLNEFRKFQEKDKLVHDIFTPEEVCKMFKINRSTLWRWEQKNKIQSFGIGGRRYFKRSQLLEALKPLKK